ncbi:hypothetical protein OHA98_16750 [Streptomyces sp. NBC_00654]|uniref:hypothetical protein n=1 Tax=Streptomyces sp. NBC_00654 TaxID=2975799 RepID=UPI0022513D2B|nr:hypothetical protein [Streptomyces sp. NBC_00654]MCX4966454.1 hypothetical protein [Streptomyces sp. NBC_00654]
MIIHAFKERSAKILSLLDGGGGLFEPKGGDGGNILSGVAEGGFDTLDFTGMSGDIQNEIMSALDETLLPGPPARIVVRRYGRGSCAPPHKFREELPSSSEPGGWTVLCALQDSEVDAITYWSGEKFCRHFDRAGSGLYLAQDSWCWTSPVRGEMRYTLAIGGEQRWKS